MAELNKELIIKIRATGRPCWVYGYRGEIIDHGLKEKALVHNIGDSAAVVEYENGTLCKVGIYQVQLLDTKEVMEEQAEAWEPKNPHLPLKRRKGETGEAFVERVQQKLKEGKLTPNAARQSLGLKPIKRDGDGLNCATCKHIARKGRGGPCQDCQNFDEWEAKA